MNLLVAQSVGLLASQMVVTGIGQIKRWPDRRIARLMLTVLVIWATAIVVTAGAR